MRASRLTELLACLGAAACAAGRVEPSVLAVERELRVPGGLVTTVSWSPDGTMLAVGGMASEVFVIDPAGIAPDRVFGQERSNGAATHVCWSADGARLAVAWRETGLALYEVAQGREIAERSTLHGPIVLRAGAPEFVCLGADGHPVRIADFTLADRGRLELPPGGAGNMLALSPDGRQLAVSMTHTCRVFTFDLEAMSGPREIADCEAAVLGLSWPVGAASPSWLDSGASLLYGFHGTRRATAMELVVQHDGSRVALLSSEGWNLVQADGTTTSLGWEHGCLALHPDGERWARGCDGRIDLGRRGAVVRSRPAPVAFEYVLQGLLLNNGGIVVTKGGGPHAFAVATGAMVSVAGLPDQGELVRADEGTQLVWRQDAQVSWWTLDERKAPIPGRRLEHQFSGLPELSHPARLYGRWLIRGTEAVDVHGELAAPRLPQSLGDGFLVPVQAGAARWVAVVGESLSSRRGDGELLLTLGPPELGMGVTGLAVSPDGTRVAVALFDRPTRVFDVASGQLLGEAGRFRDVAFVDNDTLLGAGFSPATGFDVALCTITGRRIHALPLQQWCQQWCSLLDVGPASRRALVSGYGRVLVLAWR